MSHLSQKADTSSQITVEFYGYNPCLVGYEDRKDPPIETRVLSDLEPIVLPAKTLMVRFRLSENQVNGDRGIITKPAVENTLYLPFDTWSVGGICKVITLQYPATGSLEERRRISMRSLTLDSEGNIRERYDVYGVSAGEREGRFIKTECVQRARAEDGSHHTIEPPEIVKRVLRGTVPPQLAAA